ncbi:MAG: outer membrane beta-barrel protein [Gemmatimonadetes bacterium]|nr:outer membrane beta-barrel protein [Gemmatimonadota bacterium]
MLRRTLVLGGIALATVATGATAQSAQKVSVQVSALGASLSGDGFEGWGTGTGFEGQVRYNHSALSIGGGFQLTRHALDGFDNKVSLGGAFLEPRYVIPTKSNSVAPYASLRLSVLKESGTLDDGVDEVTVSASGLTFNGGGGVLFRLTQTLNLDVGVTWGYTNFGDISAKVNGTTVNFPGLDAGSGTNAVFRVGLALGLGK